MIIRAAGTWRSKSARDEPIIVENRAQGIAKLITSDQTHQIPTQLQMGRDFGMQLFDQALLQAVTNREIDPDDAVIYASDKRLFQKFATETGITPRAEMSPPAVSQAGS